MARKSKLTNQQWQELTVLRANGHTYAELSAQFSITRKAITDHLNKQETPCEVLAQANTAMTYQDQENQSNVDISDANTYDQKTKNEINQYVQQNAVMVNQVMELQKSCAEINKRLLTFLSAGIASNQLSINNLCKLSKCASTLSKQTEIISRLYGMGTPYNQVNVQMNQNHYSNQYQYNNRPRFNKWGQPVLPDDEFTGHEQVNLIFCTSNEQAKILRSKKCENCGDEITSTQ